MSSPAGARAGRARSGSMTKPRGLTYAKPNNTTVDFKQFLIVAADNKNLTNGQSNANIITNTGHYNDPFCMSCLCSPEAFEERKRPGRGNSAYNELVACKVSNHLGCGGTQCDRCIGLGQGGTCAPPPNEAHALARIVIKLGPDYNRALIRIGALDTTCESMTDAEKATCEKMAKAAKDLRSFVQGLQKSGKVEATPTKKRTRLLMEAANEHSETADAMNDIRRDMKLQDDKIKALDTQVKYLVQNSEYQDSLLVACRARERRLLTGIDALLSEANRVREEANADRAADDQLPDLAPVTDYWREADLADEDLDNEVLNAPA